MRHASPPLLVLLLALALFACGDGDTPPYGSGAGSELPEGFDPSAPNAGARVARDFAHAVASATLDEEVMERLYAVHARVLESEDDMTSMMAVFRDSGWTMASYGQALMKFEALRTVQRRGPGRVLKELEDARGELAKVEKRAAEATGDEKDALEQQASLAKMMIPALEEHAKLAQTLEDPEVRALIDRWAEKFDALEDEE